MDGCDGRWMDPSMFEPINVFLMGVFFWGGVGVLRWRCWVLGEWLGD